VRGGAVSCRDRRLSVAFWACCAVLALGSLLPVGRDSALGATSLRRRINDLLHIPAYAVLAWLASREIENRAGRSGAVAHVLAGFAVALGFGGLMELLQGLVPGRVGSMKDVAADAAGAGAVTLYLLWRRARVRGAWGGDAVGSGDEER